MTEVCFFIEIVRAWPAALYQYDLCDLKYKDARKQLNRCAQWVAVIWDKVKMWLNWNLIISPKVDTTNLYFII